MNWQAGLNSRLADFAPIGSVIFNGLVFTINVRCRLDCEVFRIYIEVDDSTRAKLEKLKG